MRRDCRYVRLQSRLKVGGQDCFRLGPALPDLTTTMQKGVLPPSPAMHTPLESPNPRASVGPPHYLLLSETSHSRGIGRWRFRLARTDGGEAFEAADIEAELGGERLALLTVVRALEALDQPSRVTLVNGDSYVRQGIRFGLCEWRENGWRWECFGQMVPVKDADLWKRLERALEFHEVECRRWRIDGPHLRPQSISETSRPRAAQNGFSAPTDRGMLGRVSWLHRIGSALGHRVGAFWRRVTLRRRVHTLRGLVAGGRAGLSKFP